MIRKQLQRKCYDCKSSFPTTPSQVTIRQSLKVLGIPSLTSSLHTCLLLCPIESNTKPSTVGTPLKRVTVVPWVINAPLPCGALDGRDAAAHDGHDADTGLIARQAAALAEGVVDALEAGRARVGRGSEAAALLVDVCLYGSEGDCAGSAGAGCCCR